MWGFVVFVFHSAKKEASRELKLWEIIVLAAIGSIVFAVGVLYCCLRWRTRGQSQASLGTAPESAPLAAASSAESEVIELP